MHRYNAGSTYHKERIMFIAVVAVIVGLIALVWSADRFVLGAASSAAKLGMSPMLIGITIVAIGTSAPEMFVSTIASLDGMGNIAIGNALGSNIANIALVLGATALISPVPFQRALVRFDMPLLLIVSFIGVYCLYDLQLDMQDALLLIATLMVSMFILYQKDKHREHAAEVDNEFIHQELSLKVALGWVLLGMVVLILSSKSLVWGASIIARYFGLSDLIIGLTIVAIGTSLPELAASIASAYRKQHDIAIGNIIGSNLFNLLAVMPIPGLFMATSVEAPALYRDASVMLGLTVALWLFCTLNYKQRKLGRIIGALLLGSYGVYLAALA